MPYLIKELIPKKIINTIFLLLITFTLHSQTSTYKFERLSIKDGLSHSNVYAIIQDQSGYMWFGTQDGLNKYDGYNFTIYRHDPSNPNSLSTGNFGKIYQDSSGIFWFGTFGGGVDRYNPKTNTFTNFSNERGNYQSLSNNQITFFHKDKEGTLWVGTASGGLNKYNPENETFTRYNYNPSDPKSLSHIRAKCICETSDGTLWIGTGKGLNKFDKETGTFEHYLHDPNNKNSLTANGIQYLLCDKSDNIWIGTRGGGLAKFNPKTEQFTHYKYNPNNPKSLSDNKVEFLFVDSYDQFWVGTYEGGLNLFNREKEEFTHFKNDPSNLESISNNRIEYIFEDKSKILWVATRGGGINKLDLKPQKFHNIIHEPDNKNSLPHPSVMAIEHDNDGNLWIGTDGGGLSKYNLANKKFKHYQNQSGKTNTLSSDRVWSILIDNEGIIWIGTYLGGLNRLEIKNNQPQFTTYVKGDKSNFPSVQVNSIVQDRSDNIWIGTPNGLVKVIKHKSSNSVDFKTYTQNEPDSLNFVDNYISSIYVDNENRIWVGSYIGGLFQFLPEHEKFIPYSPTKLPNSEFKNEIHVVTIFQDQNNLLWIATESNGLLQLDLENKNFKQHPQNKRLLSNMIMGMTEDDLGNLWISTSRGLSKYSPWNNKLSNYTYIDGLESSGFNRNALHKTSNGTMYFGSNAALSYFEPLKVSNNPFIPKVAITDFKILNKSNWGNNLLIYEKINHKNEPIELTNKDYFFTIEFAALDFTSPLQNQYKYKLEGFDDDWIDGSNSRTATYTNLDQGSYVFKVKGSNNDKVWNNDPTELKIKVIPPYYKSWWFLSLLALIGFVIIMVLIKLRERSLIKEKEILEAKVKERTNEINLQKEELKSQSESLEKINKELEQQQGHLEQLVKKRTSDLEIAKEKAEESDKLKSAFLANMSHEIRTPMNAIIGFSNLINDPDLEDNSRAEITQLIKKNSHNLLNLIDDIIDISKLESDQLKIKEKKCNVSQILNDILTEFEDVIQDNDKVNVHVSEEILHNQLHIITDPFRLFQILKNLFSNALKFTEHGIVEFGYKIENENLHFFVKDTGIGLSSEQQKQIFARFTKIENNKMKIYRGTGLGLTITKSLVELLGGKIWVNSEINKGSTFYFTIPYKPVQEDEQPKPKKKSSLKYDWKSKTILVAEDEVSNFKFLDMIIRKTSAELLWAKTGKQAIDFCQGEKPIDLILMDIKMPEMDGLEAIKEIRKTNRMPIIVQSAYSMPEDRNLSFEAGANDFISKPIGTEKLLRIIDKHLNE